MPKIDKDIEIKSWIDLQNKLFNYKDSKIDRFRSPFVYRGLSDMRYDLKTSLYRIQENHTNVEKHLFRNFKKYAPQNLVQNNNQWIWLSIAQHHGLPTRLLDWTFSPYIALHFATANIFLDDDNKDSVIWCVDFEKAINYLPDVFKDKIYQAGSKGFSVELLDSICNEVEDFNMTRYGDILLFFEPPSIDDRIVNQFALFSIMTDPDKLINVWLENHEDLYFRLIIPNALKHEIRDKLDQANITERIIFPGLDGLAKWIKRWYSK